jgi:hypothetical protein
MTKPMALLLLPLFAACGHDVHYSGRVTDDTGVARQGLSVALAGVEFSRNGYTDVDTLSQIQPVQTLTTDRNGAFEATFHVGDNFFGCGLSSGAHPDIVVMPDGPEGAVVVARGQESGDKVDLGDLAIPATLDAHVDETGVFVALPAQRLAGTRIQVDGDDWAPSDSGAVSQFALQPCADADTCDHTVSMRWVKDNIYFRTTIGHFTAAAPVPLVATAISTTGLEVELDKPTLASAIYLDNVFSRSDLDEPSYAPQVPAILVDTGAGIVPIDPNACHIYGTGAVCEAPPTPIRSITNLAITNGQLRVFARWSQETTSATLLP